MSANQSKLTTIAGMIIVAYLAISPIVIGYLVYSNYKVNTENSYLEAKVVAYDVMLGIAEMENQENKKK